MMVSHVCWTSTEAPPWETARRYTPSDGGSLHGPTPSAACEAFCRDVLTPEEEVARVVCRGDRGGEPEPGPGANSSTKIHSWITAFQNRNFALKCSEVVLVAATNIIYSSDININIDRKNKFASDSANAQFHKLSRKKEVILPCAFFKLRVGGKHSGGIIQLK